jgi:hypothetical protein
LAASCRCAAFCARPSRPMRCPLHHRLRRSRAERALERAASLARSGVVSQAAGREGSSSDARPVSGQRRREPRRGTVSYAYATDFDCLAAPTDRSPDVTQ